MKIEKQILTVYALTQYIKLKFEKDKFMKNVVVTGEIADINIRNGNYYFRLKDDFSIISCVLFSQYVSEEAKLLVVGDCLDIHGDISVYTKTGAYQIYVKAIEMQGIGKLHQEFELIKNRLQNEGLFDVKHKQGFPQYPQTIALITASNSAALQDMLITLKRRYPLAIPVFYSSSMQGKTAVPDILKRLQQADEGQHDVIVLARGGGSYEDLQAFNDEMVARKISALKTPLITGIGHQTDVTIADFVADLRAATPTAAIETVTPDQKELMTKISKSQENIDKQLQQQLSQKQILVAKLYQRINNKKPENQILLEKQQLFNSWQRLFSIEVENKVINEQVKRFELMSIRLRRAMVEKLQQHKLDVAKRVENVALLSPLEVISRGYAIVEQKGQIITSIQQVKQQEELTIILKDGKIGCTINQINKN
ncbi:MAG: exodeoxyribonuclease VII large subunit [Culicoidibacterales bacterium]